MPSRKITDLHPHMQPLVGEWLRRCEEEGLDVLVTCTFRSNAEQAALYAQGRTKPGRIVTNAKAGQSSHNFTLNGRPASKALDYVPLRNGKLVWGTSGDGIDDNPSDDARDDLELWQRTAAIAEAVGLKWAGRWTKFREFPHIYID